MPPDVVIFPNYPISQVMYFNNQSVAENVLGEKILPMILDEFRENIANPEFIN